MSQTHCTHTHTHTRRGISFILYYDYEVAPACVMLMKKEATGCVYTVCQTVPVHRKTSPHTQNDYEISR